MSEFESLSHSRWNCKYHVVFVPKGRKKELFGKIRRFLGTIFLEQAMVKRCKIIEGHMLNDHVHMMIKIWQDGCRHGYQSDKWLRSIL